MRRRVECSAIRVLQTILLKEEVVSAPTHYTVLVRDNWYQTYFTLNRLPSSLSLMENNIKTFNKLQEVKPLDEIGLAIFRQLG